MFKIKSISSTLIRNQRNIWHAANRTAVSYPNVARALCHMIEDNSFWFKHRNRCIVEMMRLYPPAGTVFDVGGGNGFVSLALKNSGIETVLVEPGPEGVENAFARGMKPIICSTLEDAEFKPHTIPAIGIFDVLEHIEHDMQFLRLLHGTLISGGRIYITVPAYPFLWSDTDTYSGHLRRYTIRLLTQKLESVGFQVEFDSYIFWALVVPIFFCRTLLDKVPKKRVKRYSGWQDEMMKSVGSQNRLMMRLLGIELNMLSHKKSIPFGGSCLVVAKRL